MSNFKFQISNYIFFLLSLVAVISSYCLLIYWTNQQILRQSSYDPQIEIAEDTANLLNSGQNINTILPSSKVDPSISLAPFIIVYNTQGSVTATTVILNNQTPNLPPGVLDFTKVHDQDRLTWQPQAGVRVAAVVTRFNNGYVLAGKSLIETEKRTENLLFQVASAWVVTVLVVTVLTTFAAKKTR